MNYANIPAAFGRAHLITRLPSSAQSLVDDGVQAAETWIADDHGRTHEEYLLLHLRNLEEDHHRAFSDGYFGRIHQRLKSCEDFDASGVIAAGGELTHQFLTLLQEGARLASEGKLKPKTFKARDFLVRLDDLTRRVTEIPSGEPAPRHHRGRHE